MIITMLISMVLLITAGFANAASISGYVEFKDGVRNTLNLRNATVRLTVYEAVDGVLDEESVKDLIFTKADLGHEI